MSDKISNNTNPLFFRNEERDLSGSIANNTNPLFSFSFSFLRNEESGFSGRIASRS